MLCLVTLRKNAERAEIESYNNGFDGTRWGEVQHAANRAEVFSAPRKVARSATRQVTTIAYIVPVIN